MSKALRSIERILNVQKQKLRLAEWKIFNLQRQQSALAENQNALTQLLEKSETQGSDLARMAMRAVRRAGLQTAHLEQAEAIAQRQMQDVYRHVKLSEHLFTDRNLEDQRQNEKQLLDDMIDQRKHENF